MAISQLLANTGIWQGQAQGTQRASIATGFEALDACFPGGGWPVGALTEVFAEHHGIGELSLFMPALARIAQSGSADRGSADKEWIAWVAPPFVPYAPALIQYGLNLEKSLLIRPQPNSADELWALEQVLRSGVCCAVLAWLGSCGDKALRRMQLLAEAGSCLVIVFRPMSALASGSPAALRLQLASNERGAKIQILKCRGRRAEIVQMPGWHLRRRSGAQAGSFRADDPGAADGDAWWR